MHQYTVKILQFKNVHNLNWKFISGDIAVNLSQLCQAQQGSRVGVTAPVGLHLGEGIQQWRHAGPIGEVCLHLCEPKQPRSSHSGNRLLVIQYCLHIFQNLSVYWRGVSLLIAKTGANPAIRNIAYETAVWGHWVTHSYFKATSHKATLPKPPSPKPNVWRLTLGSLPELSNDGLSRVKPEAASLVPQALRTDMQ